MHPKFVKVVTNDDKDIFGRFVSYLPRAPAGIAALGCGREKTPKQWPPPSEVLSHELREAAAGAYRKLIRTNLLSGRFPGWNGGVCSERQSIRGRGDRGVAVKWQFLASMTAMLTAAINFHYTGSKKSESEKYHFISRRNKKPLKIHLPPWAISGGFRVVFD